MDSRRGFLSALLGLAAAPLVPKPSGELVIPVRQIVERIWINVYLDGKNIERTIRERRVPALQIGKGA